MKHQSILRYGRHYEPFSNTNYFQFYGQMNTKLQSTATTHLTKANPLLSLENLSRGI